MERAQRLGTVATQVHQDKPLAQPVEELAGKDLPRRESSHGEGTIAVTAVIRGREPALGREASAAARRSNFLATLRASALVRARLRGMRAVELRLMGNPMPLRRARG